MTHRRKSSLRAGNVWSPVAPIPPFTPLGTIMIMAGIVIIVHDVVLRLLKHLLRLLVRFLTRTASSQRPDVSNLVSLRDVEDGYEYVIGRIFITQAADAAPFKSSGYRLNDGKMTRRRKWQSRT